MNKGTKKLPVGVEDFKEIRTGDYYYVDKTGLVAELIERRGKVNLFTRPRRFGKSLNISMLQYFFEYGCDPMLFNGLQIIQDKEICKKYMGKFPVVSVSLKDVDANCYKTARGLLCVIIGREATKFQFLMESDKLTSQEKARYQKLINAGKLDEPDFPMPDEVLISSLRTLTELLYKHYGEQVILLIDEYDVPLDKAQQSGYYDDMVTLIRTLFGQALKTGIQNLHEDGLSFLLFSQAIEFWYFRTLPPQNGHFPITGASVNWDWNFTPFSLSADNGAVHFFPL